MITVTIWHNIARDADGTSTAMLNGHQPGDPMVRVFTYQADPAGGPEAVAEDAFGIFNGHPRCASDGDLARAYYERELRSLSKGDVVVIGEVALAVASAGWTPVSGSLNEARADEHGTHPLPAVGPGTAPGDETVPGDHRHGHRAVRAHRARRALRRRCHPRAARSSLPGCGCEPEAVAYYQRGPPPGRLPLHLRCGRD